MYKLNLSELAHHDLDRIVSYITVNLASLFSASTFWRKGVRIFLD